MGKGVFGYFWDCDVLVGGSGYVVGGMCGCCGIGFDFV